MKRHMPCPAPPPMEQAQQAQQAQEAQQADGTGG